MGRRNCKAQKQKQKSYSQRRQSDDDLVVVVVVVVIVFVTKFQVNCKILTKLNEKSTATKKTKKCCAKAVFQKKKYVEQA